MFRSINKSISFTKHNPIQNNNSFNKYTTTIHSRKNCFVKNVPPSVYANARAKIVTDLLFFPVDVHMGPKVVYNLSRDRDEASYYQVGDPDSSAPEWV